MDPRYMCALWELITIDEMEKCLLSTQHAPNLTPLNFVILRADAILTACINTSYLCLGILLLHDCSTWKLTLCRAR
jgi:hypothetical protein